MTKRTWIQNHVILQTNLYKYQTARSELLKCKNIDRVEYLKNEKKRKENTKQKKNKKVFWISKFDPRVPHPRQVLSKNYHILEGDPIARDIFERKNLVAGSRRGKNIQELISPTVQKLKPLNSQMGPKLPRGSFQCQNFKEGKKCELCNHMKDGVEYVKSSHFGTKHAVRGHLVHQPRNQQFKDRWFVYLIQDEHCNKQYVGSTTDMYGRWSSHKSGCNNGCNKTGLSNHFTNGCPGDTGRNKMNLTVTLLESMDMTREEVQLCNELKNIEDDRMMKLGKRTKTISVDVAGYKILAQGFVLWKLNEITG